MFQSKFLIKRIIHAIYQNCPNLIYLKLSFQNNGILELDQLLTNCQYLDGLYHIIESSNWDNLFDILTKSSPTNLFKLRFHTQIGIIKNYF